MGIYDQAYSELQNNFQYWEERCRGEEASMAQMDGIIPNLKTLYKEWKNKYTNMVVLTNYALQDFPEKLKRLIWSCAPRTPLKKSTTLSNYAKGQWQNISPTSKLSTSLKGLPLGLTSSLHVFFPVQQLVFCNSYVLVIVSLPRMNETSLWFTLCILLYSWLQCLNVKCYSQ